MNQYATIVNACPWNHKYPVHILRAVHGTDIMIAEKICETGFAALSSLDAGYYGKGIYFTSYSEYCLPYMSQKKNPCLIAAYLLPGNIYPVVENHAGPKSLMGAALKNGFTSHYVVTDRAGVVVTGPTQHKTWDEIVIPQEAQIVPAFIFEIESKNLARLMKGWSKLANRESGLATTGGAFGM